MLLLHSPFGSSGNKKKKIPQNNHSLTKHNWHLGSESYRTDWFSDSINPTCPFQIRDMHADSFEIYRLFTV